MSRHYSVVFVDVLRAALLSALPHVNITRSTFAFVDTSPSNGEAVHPSRAPTLERVVTTRTAV